jgi:5-methylcytosine-specific restriction endonuclease McrA
MQGQPPSNLELADPTDRQYPASWRDAAIRTLFDPAVGGVLCCGCKYWFKGLKNLSLLEADHILPWAKGGLTTWENLQILCRTCNRAKGCKRPTP